MKPLVTLALVLASIVLLSNAQGQSPAQPPPPGIHAEDWIPISSNLGFVILNDQSISPRRVGPASVRGYFVAYRQNMWQRLEVAPQMGLYRVEGAH